MTELLPADEALEGVLNDLDGGDDRFSSDESDRKMIYFFRVYLKL